MRNLDLSLFSRRLRLTLCAMGGALLFGGGGLVASIEPPAAFRSTRGTHSLAVRTIDDHGSVTEAHSQQSVVQPALAIIKILRRVPTSRHDRAPIWDRVFNAMPRICPLYGSRVEPSVLVANAADLRRLCRLLL